MDFPIKEIKLSHSGIERYNECNRKYALEYIYANNQDRRSTIDTCFGSSVGAGIAAGLLSPELQYAATLAYWDLPIGEEKKNKNFKTALIAAEYGTFLVKETFDNQILATINDRKAIETSFYWKLGEVTIDGKKYTVRYKGFADIVMQDETGLLTVLDIKTTANYQGFSFEELFNSPQILLYIFMLRLAGYKVASEGYFVVVNTAKKLPEVELVPIEFTKEMVKDAIKDLEKVAMEIVQSMTVEHFRKNYKGCKMYNSTCNFFDICQRPTLRTLDAVDFSEIEEDNREENYDVYINDYEILRDVL